MVYTMTKLATGMLLDACMGMVRSLAAKRIQGFKLSRSATRLMQRSCD